MPHLRKEDFIAVFKKHVWYVRKHKIPLRTEKMLNAIENGLCPFSCRCCEGECVAKKCVELRDRYSYSPNAIFFRKGLTKETKQELMRFLKSGFALEI